MQPMAKDANVIVTDAIYCSLSCSARTVAQACNKGTEPVVMGEMEQEDYNDSGLLVLFQVCSVGKGRCITCSRKKSVPFLLHPQAKTGIDGVNYFFVSREQFER